MGDGARHFIGFGIQLIRTQAQLDGSLGIDVHIGIRARRNHGAQKNNHCPGFAGHSVWALPKQSVPAAFGVYDA